MRTVNIERNLPVPGEVAFWIVSTMTFFIVVLSDTRPIHTRSPLLASRKRIGNSRSSSSLSSSLPISTVQNNENDSEPKLYPEKFHSQPTTDRTVDGLTVSLRCARDRMQLDLNFQQPFRGSITVGRQDDDNGHRKRACEVRGNGSRKYQMDVSHLNCGTLFNDRSGHFSNTLFIRHHPTLETGADHSKTLLCKFGLAQFNVT